MNSILFPAIEEFLREKDRNKVQHVELLIPGQDFEIRIMDASLLIENSGEENNKALVYISVNNKSKQGIRITKSAEMLDTFKNYKAGDAHRRFIRFLLLPPVYKKLTNEITAIINDLFPKIKLSDIRANLIRRDNRTIIEE